MICNRVSIHDNASDVNTTSVKTRDDENKRDDQFYDNSLVSQRVHMWHHTHLMLGNSKRYGLGGGGGVSGVDERDSK